MREKTTQRRTKPRLGFSPYGIGFLFRTTVDPQLAGFHRQQEKSRPIAIVTGTFGTSMAD
jgi:hypothetical protein